MPKKIIDNLLIVTNEKLEKLSIYFFVTVHGQYAKIFPPDFILWYSWYFIKRVTSKLSVTLYLKFTNINFSGVKILFNYSKNVDLKMTENSNL